jgi:hypothetical protein
MVQLFLDGSLGSQFLALSPLTSIASISALPLMRCSRSANSPSSEIDRFTPHSRPVPEIACVSGPKDAHLHAGDCRRRSCAWARIRER